MSNRERIVEGLSVATLVAVVILVVWVTIWARKSCVNSCLDLGTFSTAAECEKACRAKGQ